MPFRWKMAIWSICFTELEQINVSYEGSCDRKVTPPENRILVHLIFFFKFLLERKNENNIEIRCKFNLSGIWATVFFFKKYTWNLFIFLNSWGQKNVHEHPINANLINSIWKLSGCNLFITEMDVLTTWWFLGNVKHREANGNINGWENFIRFGGLEQILKMFKNLQEIKKIETEKLQKQFKEACIYDATETRSWICIFLCVRRFIAPRRFFFQKLFKIQIFIDTFLIQKRVNIKSFLNWNRIYLNN